MIGVAAALSHSIKLEKRKYQRVYELRDFKRSSRCDKLEKSASVSLVGIFRNVVVRADWQEARVDDDDVLFGHVAPVRLDA